MRESRVRKSYEKVIYKWSIHWVRSCIKLSSSPVVLTWPKPKIFPPNLIMDLSCHHRLALQLLCCACPWFPSPELSSSYLLRDGDTRPLLVGLLPAIITFNPGAGITFPWGVADPHCSLKVLFFNFIQIPWFCHQESINYWISLTSIQASILLHVKEGWPSDLGPKLML